MATITKDLGPVTAYKYAVSKGYTGTEEEFAELMANLATAIELFSDVQDDMEQLEGTVNSTVSTVDTIDDRVDTIDDRVTALEEQPATQEWENVLSSITLTPGTNCASIPTKAARKIGKMLYLTFTVKPVANLAAGADVYVEYSGLPLLTAVISYSLRSITLLNNKMYLCWASVNNKTNCSFRCRLWDTSVAWSSSVGIEFSFSLPLE